MSSTRRTDGRAEKTLYRNGSVHSPADPFATALLVQDGQIVWVGEEAGADSLVDAQVVEVDLDGLVLTPGFTGLLRQAPSSADWASLAAAGWTQAVTEQEDGLRLVGLDGTDAVREGVRIMTDAATARGTHQLVLEASAASDAWIATAREALAGGEVVALVRDCSAAADGMRPSPWSVCWQGLAASSDSEPGLAVRATFHAQTRAVDRIFGTGGPLSGQLAPGSPASFVGWRAEALMVQTADSRIAAWSTDPRARTPLLPALEEGRPLPEAALAVVGGRRVLPQS